MRVISIYSCLRKNFFFFLPEMWKSFWWGFICHPFIYLLIYQIVHQSETICQFWGFFGACLGVQNLSVKSLNKGSSIYKIQEMLLVNEWLHHSGCPVCRVELTSYMLSRLILAAHQYQNCQSIVWTTANGCSSKNVKKCRKYNNSYSAWVKKHKKSHSEK